MGKSEKHAAERAESGIENCDVSYETMLSSSRGYLFASDELSEVYLFGSYHNKGLYADELRIEIRNLAGATIKQFKPQLRGGYSARIALLPFLKNGLSQIYLAADGGGSGAFAYYNIYSLCGGTEKLIFSNDQFDEKFHYAAEYAADYRLCVVNDESKRNFTIDLRNKDKNYLDSLYTENGSLKQQTKGNVSPLNAVFPFYNATENRYDLIAYQRITGLFSADSYGYLINHLRFLPTNQFESYFEMLGII